MAGKILITGANGNLGNKLIAHLATAPWCDGIVAVCHGGEPDLEGIAADRVSVSTADLTKAGRAELQKLVEGVDAVVHFAAQNPYPMASWQEAAASFDMTLAILDAAEVEGVRRFVFASSNHVMGGYKELSDEVAPGGLTTDMAPLPGTLAPAPDGTISAPPAYATAKLMGERASVLRARATNGRPSTVCLRIGWCQPGENRARTINAAGLPGTEVDVSDPVIAKMERWFKGMWLSNRDFVHLVECAILSASDQWPSLGIVVNGMSNNRGMVWDIDTTRRLIGYAPQDDVWSD